MQRADERPLVGSTDWFVEADAEYQDEGFDNDENNLVFADGDIPVFQAGSSPEQIPAGQFFNHATVILPDEREFGLRVNYRFAGE